MANLFYKEYFIVAVCDNSPAGGWIEISWQDELGRHSHIIRNPAIKPSSDKTAEDCLVELAKNWIDAQPKTSTQPKTSNG